jgi:hypothetical protein
MYDNPERAALKPRRAGAFLSIRATNTSSCRLERFTTSESPALTAMTLAAHLSGFGARAEPLDFADDVEFPSKLLSTTWHFLFLFLDSPFISEL